MEEKKQYYTQQEIDDAKKLEKYLKQEKVSSSGNKILNAMLAKFPKLVQAISEDVKFEKMLDETHEPLKKRGIQIITDTTENVEDALDE